MTSKIISAITSLRQGLSVQSCHHVKDYQCNHVITLRIISAIMLSRQGLSVQSSHHVKDYSDNTPGPHRNAAGSFLRSVNGGNGER